MLSRIKCVTFMAPDLGAVRSAYEEFLGYQVSDEGQISSQLAEVWGAPACSDRSYILMQPEASQDFCFRFIEVIEAINYKPLTTFGWNAAELIVQDVDSLAERLVGSPFKIIGQPEDLSFSSAIRAMQVIGPAQEVLYLTQFKQKVSEFQVPDAESFVGETFIAILGGAHIAEIEDFYGRVLGVPHAPIFEAKIAILSEAFGLPVEQLHPIAALPLHNKCYIEVDQLPDEAGKRQERRDDLPPAMAMVSFETASLEQLESSLVAPACRIDDAPYYGQRVGVLRGAAGELIELIESPSLNSDE